MHYLITGGAGFIGSHLADYLLQRGDHVTIIDDLSTGSIKNIAHLRSDPRFEYHIDTMLNPQLLAELVDPVDGVFHLAAAVGVKLIVQSPVRTMETNIRCTELLLATAEKKKKRVFMASTSEVYGKNTDIPFREEGDLVLGATTRGRWSYACSKAVDEFLAIAYWRERKLPTVIARLFNTVGPRQTGQYGMVIPRFVEQALAGEDITVYGDGTQRRCFGHVRDVVGGIVGLMECDEAIGGVFNIGSTEEISIGQLAELVREKTRSSSRIVNVPFEVAYDRDFEDMPRRIPSTDKISSYIGWKPTSSLNEILHDVVREKTTALVAVA
jgi:UDP-glucose 4-epimerase